MITSEAIAPTLTPPGPSQNADVSADTVATVDLGTLSAAGIGPWTVTVAWGDGQSSTLVTTSTGPLTDTHDYTSTGDETISVAVAEKYGETTTISFPIDVVNSGTTTTLTSPSPVMYGQSTTVTATVSGSGTPTGTVLLYLGAVAPADQIGSGTLSGADQVTFTTPADLDVSGSPYTLIAVYGGDASHQGSQQLTSMMINPYAFTYQISNDAQTYGMPANLAKDLPATISTDVNGQILNINYSSPGDTATAPVGTYPITGKLSSGTGKLSDYSVTLDPGTLTVAMPTTQSIYVLDPTAGGALNLSGSAGSTSRAR